jgi:hypothetical protein
MAMCAERNTSVLMDGEGWIDELMSEAGLEPGYIAPKPPPFSF